MEKTLQPTRKLNTSSKPADNLLFLTPKIEYDFQKPVFRHQASLQVAQANQAAANPPFRSLFITRDIVSLMKRQSVIKALDVLFNHPV